MLQMAVTNWLGQTLIKNAIEEMLKARTERERDEIRARIDRELAALRDAQNTSQ
jgi:prophage DNA circulation protein